MNTANSPKTVSLPYAQGQRQVTFPSGYTMTTIAPQDGDVLPNPDAAVRNALQQPTGLPPLQEWAKPGEGVVIVVSDATRPALQSLYLPHTLAELETAGVADKDILLVIALGIHRPPTKEELRHLLGDALDRYPVTWSDCDDAAALVDLGTTSRGTPVRIFRPVVEADRVILTGSVHHHVIAGFSAGAKSLLPGVAGRDTIQANHALVLQPPGKSGLNPDCTAGKLVGNPLQEDIMEALAMFPKPVFLVNIVPAPGEGLLQVVAGDVLEAHRRSCETAASFYSVPIEKRRSFVFASCGGFPLDMVLYQSTKGLINMSQALENGGVGVLMAACSQGVGAKGFAAWMRLGSPAAIETRLRKNFTVPGVIAYTVSHLLQRAALFLVSELDHGLVSELGFLPADSPQHALELAAERLGPRTQGYLMSKASIMVPLLA